MADLLLALIKIVAINFLVFYIFNKYLASCLLAGNIKRWSVAYGFLVFLLMVGSRFLNQSPTFAFFLSISLYVLLLGFSANFKESQEMYEVVEKITASAKKYVLIASILGYLTYASIF